MERYILTIDEKSKKAKSLIAKLRASEDVIDIRTTASIIKRFQDKVHREESAALRAFMKKVETGKLVSRAKIMKTLKSIK
jgi:hypothetical protein